MRLARKPPRRWWFFRAGAPGHLDFDLIRHGLPLLGCAVVWSGSHIWRKYLPPVRAGRVERALRGPEEVNALDLAARQALLWKDPLRARLYSNLLANFLIPAGTVALTVAAGIKGGGGPFADVLVANEAMVYAGTVSQAVKLIVRRQRPFARFEEEGAAGAPRADGSVAIPANRTRARLARANLKDDDDLSFFSSHTSTTMAFAFAVAQIATRRRVRTPLVFLLGVAAGLTGYLRIASDRHYLTDALAGGVVGAAFGTLVPRLLHPIPRPDRWSRAVGADFARLLGQS